MHCKSTPLGISHLFRFRGLGLSAEDIRAAYATMGITRTLEECSWVVEEIDTTGDGVINFNDFCTAMRPEYDRAPTEEEVSMFFQSMDLLDNGFVDIGDIQVTYFRPIPVNSLEKFFN